MTKWKLVPADPTPEMLDASWDTLRHYSDWRATAGEVYAAMLAVASKSPEEIKLRAERDALLAKNKRQKRELRRLNKYLGPYWAGFRRNIGLEGEMRLRQAMFDAFGYEAVKNAELASTRSAIDAASPSLADRLRAKGFTEAPHPNMLDDVLDGRVLRGKDEQA